MPGAIMGAGHRQMRKTGENVSLCYSWGEGVEENGEEKKLK